MVRRESLYPTIRLYSRICFTVGSSVWAGSLWRPGMFLAGRSPGRVRSRSLKGRKKRGAFSADRTPAAGASPLPGKLTSVCLSLLPGGYRAAGSFPGASSSGEAVVQGSLCLRTPQDAEPSHPGTIGAALGPEPSLSLSISSHTLSTDKRWDLPGGPAVETLLVSRKGA